jgi:hypothetical protein
MALGEGSLACSLGCSDYCSFGVYNPPRVEEEMLLSSLAFAFFCIIQHPMAESFLYRDIFLPPNSYLSLSKASMWVFLPRLTSYMQYLAFFGGDV